jgi:hypothetical protein
MITTITLVGLQTMALIALVVVSDSYKCNHLYIKQYFNNSYLYPLNFIY